MIKVMDIFAESKGGSWKEKDHPREGWYWHGQENYFEDNPPSMGVHDSVARLFSIKF